MTSNALIFIRWNHSKWPMRDVDTPWWRHQMETFSALLAFCEGITGGLPSQRPVSRSFDVFFISAWKNGWVNNRDASDLRHHRAHYDVMIKVYPQNYMYCNARRPNEDDEPNIRPVVLALISTVAFTVVNKHHHGPHTFWLGQITVSITKTSTLILHFTHKNRQANNNRIGPMPIHKISSPWLTDTQNQLPMINTNDVRCFLLL